LFASSAFSSKANQTTLHPARMVSVRLVTPSFFLSPSDPPRAIDPDPHRTGGIAATLDTPSVDHENRVTQVHCRLRELSWQQLEGPRNSNKSCARDEISTVDDHAGAPSN
jgi:hypothetical protein